MIASLPLPPDADRWLEALPAPVLGIDAGERVRFANAAAAEALGAGGRGLQGRPLAEIVGADAPLLLLTRRARTLETRVVEADLEISGPGLSPARAAGAAAPVGEQGHVALVLHFKPPMRAGARAGAVIAARTLAHEVRNPLAGIRAAAQLMAREASPEAAGLSELICAEVDRVARLVDRFDPMDAPRVSHQPINVHAALERVRALIAASFPHVRIDDSFDPSLPPIRGDMDQLIQALLNITKNAAESASASPDPRISVRTRFRPGVRVRSGVTGAARAQLEIAVTDNGPGVGADIAERLFEPFASTKPGGMGLGLSIAADIVARHGGLIEVDGAPGAAQFRILLPIEREE